MGQGQRGVALISVLLVMSLALLLTGAMLRSHRLLIATTAQQIHQVHLRQLSLAGERWAREQLGQGASDEDSKRLRTHLGQAWAREEMPLDVDGGEVQVRIVDLAGRFNLGTVFRGGKVDPITLGRWTRLLEQLDIPPFAMPEQATGGLDNFSQLRLLAGVDGRALARLRSWVSVLPTAASLNVNTAPAQVLASLQGVSLARATQLVNQRPAEGYASVQEFSQSQALAGLDIGSHGLGVDSRWFRVSVDAELGGQRMRLISDFERNAKDYRLRLLQRQFLAPNSSESSL